MIRALALGPTQRLGQVIGGQYRIDSVLHETNDETLFAGTCVADQAPCAVRVYRATLQGEDSKAFFASAAAVKELKHDHVAEVLGFGATEDGQHFVAVNMPQEKTLASLLSSTGAQSVGRTAALLLPLAQMLNELHLKGQVHNGINLSAISLSADASTSQLREMNLVVNRARLAESAYAAPERKASGRSTAASDVWAMGMVAFECLSGKPFPGDASSNTDTSTLRSMAPHVSAPIAEFLSRALSADPNTRFESMHAFASAFEVLASDESDEESQTVPVTFVTRAADGTVKPKAAIAAPVIAGLKNKESTTPRPVGSLKQPVPPPRKTKTQTPKLKKPARPSAPPKKTQPSELSGRPSAPPKRSVPPTAPKKSAPPPAPKKSAPPPAPKKSAPPPAPKKSVPPPAPKKSVPPPAPKKSVPPPAPKKSVPSEPKVAAPLPASPPSPPSSPLLTGPPIPSAPRISSPPPDSETISDLASDLPEDSAQRRLVESVRPSTGKYPPAVVADSVAVELPETFSRRGLLIGGGCAFFAMSCCGFGTCVSSYIGDEEEVPVAAPPKKKRVAPQVPEVISEPVEEAPTVPRLSDPAAVVEEPVIEAPPAVMKKRRRRRRRKRRRR